MLLTEITQLATRHLRVESIHPDDFVFDNKARIKCFYCEKYGRNHCCPPNLPKLDYRKLIHNCNFMTFGN